MARALTQYLICSLMPALAAMTAPIAAAADPATPSGDEILARVTESNARRHLLLKDYAGLRDYRVNNLRFGKQAVTAVRMDYHEGENFTVLARSGSDKLSAIIDRILAAEAIASRPPESAAHQITSANYRVRLLGKEVAAGRECYVLELMPAAKSKPAAMLQPENRAENAVMQKLLL